MKLAFCIFKYFPYGGLQRDMYHAAEAAIARGHEVDIYTMHWQGSVPPGVKINIISARGFTNHGHATSFAAKLVKIFDEYAYDRIVGFNKIPGLDIYFTGENCFAQHVAKKAMWITRYIPRYYFFSLLERKIFDKKSNTEVLLISPQEKKIYQKFYHTKNNRFHFLSPSIEKRTFSNEEAVTIRSATRQRYQVTANHIWLLFVASDYALKGLDRVLEFIQTMDTVLSEKIILSVIGDDNSAIYQEFLRKHHIKTRVDFFGAMDNIYQLMSSADLLVHPAKLELAGKVLLEAIVNHLPTLTTAVCGCARYIAGSQGGEVLPEPYSQQQLTQTLTQMLQPGNLRRYRESLIDYQIDPSVYQSHQHLVDYIETLPARSMRNFFVDDFLKQFIPLYKKNCLTYIFSLKGQIYRQVKGRKTIAIVVAGRQYFVKMHYGVGWSEILKNILVFKSVALGAKQEYQAIRHMEKAKILVPQICAYATTGFNPAKINSFIMTKHIHYQYDLESLCKTWLEKPPSFVFKRQLIRRVAEITRKMHAAGMNHRDFYLCHLLLDVKTNTDFDLYLIDLHRVQIRKKAPLRWRVKDLSGLYFSAMDIGLTCHDKYYFLMHYHQQSLKDFFKKKSILYYWIEWRAKKLYRRHITPSHG